MNSKWGSSPDTVQKKKQCNFSIFWALLPLPFDLMIPPNVAVELCSDFCGASFKILSFV